MAGYHYHAPTGLLHSVIDPSYFLSLLIWEGLKCEHIREPSKYVSLWGDNGNHTSLTFHFSFFNIDMKTGKLWYSH
jgi:hypothetical protein